MQAKVAHFSYQALNRLTFRLQSDVHAALAQNPAYQRLVLYKDPDRQSAPQIHL